MVDKILDKISNIKNLYTGELIDENSFVRSIDYNKEDNKAILNLNYLGSDENLNKLINREVIKALKIDLKILGVKLVFNEEKLSIDLSKVKVIAISSGKGGVGKSQVAYNLANTLAKKGHKTALVDADILGYSIPKISDVYGDVILNNEGNIIPLKNKNGLEIISTQFFIEGNENEAIIWRAAKFNQLLNKFFTKTAYNDNLEYMIIDLPPGTGDIILSLSQYFEKINFILVTTPSDDATYVATRSLSLANSLEFNILGVVNNMAYYEIENKKHFIFGKYEEIKPYDKLIDIPIKGIDFNEDFLNPYYDKLVDTLLTKKIEINI